MERFRIVCGCGLGILGELIGRYGRLNVIISQGRRVQPIVVGYRIFTLLLEQLYSRGCISATGIG